MYELNEKYKKFINDVIIALRKENYEVEISNDFSVDYLVVFINGKSFHISDSVNGIINQFYGRYSSLLIEPEKFENTNSQYIFTKYQYSPYEEQLKITIDYLKKLGEVNEPLNVLIEKIEV